MRLGRVLASCVAAFALGCSAPPSGQSTARAEDVLLSLDTDVVEGRVPRAATLETLLKQYKVDPAVVAPLTTAVREVFNPRRLKADQSFKLTKTLDGLFREFRYDIDATQFLRVVFRDRDSGGQPSFDVELIDRPREITVDAAAAEITSERPSLIAAFEQAGESVQLPLGFADIFSGEIDFNSELQRGDVANVLFERVTVEGEPAGYGDVHAAVLEHEGRRFVGIPFAASDGKVGWYDENGRSLKRQFLKSPLPIDLRVTSGFSRRRLHPIFGSYRAHLGVDYAAGIGTPVLAMSDGVVQFAGWSGQSGRMVVLRHAGGYETYYLHLSSFGPGIKRGIRVTQKQVIGRVGMSGAATGPHLDFRVRMHGAFVNPLVVRSRMPPGEPIPADRMAEFQRARDEALHKLELMVAESTTAAVHDPDRR